VRILWLKTELLHPVDKGGKIRTFHMLKELKKDAHVTYLTLDDSDASDAERELAKEYCHEVVTVAHRAAAKFSPGFYKELLENVVSPLPYSMAKYRNRAMARTIATQLNALGKDDVLVADFLFPCVNLPAGDWGVPSVLFQHNVEAVILRRHAETQANLAKKAFLYGQYAKMWLYERQTCRRFDEVVAVSKDDREKMVRDYGLSAVGEVATGVDVEFFRASGNQVVNPHEVAFTGSMDWLPNEDAIQWFTSEILPRIKQRLPDFKLTVVGRNPYPSLLELAKRESGIEVTGRVPDVRPYIERAAAYVVPIRIGGGTRLKIYEAMAMGRPLVSTTIGAEGLPIEDGKDLLLADDPQAFADTVVKVLTDAELARRVGETGARTVRERFGWGKVSAQFLASCEAAIRARRGR
jgi:glycosyltransferase involved in cell wall biosynthesis